MTDAARDSKARTGEGASSAPGKIDLGVLSELNVHATMAPWHADEGVVKGGPFNIAIVPHRGDREWIIAARNAFTELLTAARERDEAADELGWLRAVIQGAIDMATPVLDNDESNLVAAGALIDLRRYLTEALRGR